MDLGLAGKVAIIGAKHDLATGVVTFFDDTWVHNEASMYALSGRAPGNGNGDAKAPSRA